MTENEPKLASKIQEVHAKLSEKNINRLAYIVKVIDPSYSEEIRVLGALKLDLTNLNFLKIIGIDLPYIKPKKSAKTESIVKTKSIVNNNYDDLISKAEKDILPWCHLDEPFKSALIEEMIPWQKVINIYNVNYKYKAK